MGETTRHFLRHHYEPVRANTTDYYGDGFGAITELPTSTKTAVLLRCSCGKTKVKTLKGAWSLADLTSNPEGGW